MRIPLRSSLAYIHSSNSQGMPIIPITLLGDDTPQGMRLFEELSEETTRPSQSLYSIEGSYGWRLYKVADHQWWVRDQLCGYTGVSTFIWFATATRLAEQGASHFEVTALKLVIEQINILLEQGKNAELIVCLLPDNRGSTVHALDGQAKARALITQSGIQQPYHVKITLPGASKSSLLRLLDERAKLISDDQDLVSSHPHLFVDDWVRVTSGEVVGESGEIWSVSEDFVIGQSPVTQSLYEAVMERQLPIRYGPLYPATAVSWIEAVQFCNQLSILLGLSPYYELDQDKVLTHVIDPNGLGIRLPRRAEWCYAASGKRSWPYSGSNIPEEVAWSAHNSGSKVRPVARLKHNEFGLYDMSGNVWEWCEEGARDQEQSEICSGDHHPKWLLGGSWANHPWVFPIGEALAELPGYRDEFMGFRIARSLGDDERMISWRFDQHKLKSDDEV